MTGIEGSEALRGPSRPQGRRAQALYAALDLGTNNCRLLIAAPAPGGFRVVHGWSQIVRLGEGLGATGRLSDAAMARTMAALAQCAARLQARGVARVGCVATQACRQAENGAAFLRAVEAELGLHFTIIAPEEEARLAAIGCASLIDPGADRALIVDIGGGSTEISLVDARAYQAAPERAPPILDWTSSPVGVVQLAERLPERADRTAWYEDMCAAVRASLLDFATRTDAAHALRAGHIIGTSGTVTSLAGVHLDLPRYQRNRVDGLWMRYDACRAAAARLLAMTPAERAAHPCIGRERADLVLPGCAILEAVLSLWPGKRLRVADRGLREGVLMRLMAEDGW